MRLGIIRPGKPSMTPNPNKKRPRHHQPTRLGPITQTFIFFLVNGVENMTSAPLA